MIRDRMRQVPEFVDRLASRPVGPRAGLIVLVVMLAAALLVSGLTAYSKPLWHDEVYTAILTDLPDRLTVRRALLEGVDDNPPAYYDGTRIAGLLIPDRHLAYRAPSVAGFLFVIVCIYAILSARIDRLSALGATSLLLVTPVAGYAHEARPYALMLAGVCLAILGWQRIGERRWCEWALGLGLAAAVSFHYFAVLVWPAFVVAEIVRWWSRGVFRLRAWVALVAGAVPVLLTLPRIMRIHAGYDQHPWSPPSWRQIVTGPDWLFEVGHAGFIIAVGIAAAVAYELVGHRLGASHRNEAPPSDDHGTGGTEIVGDAILCLGLLAVPVGAVIGAMVTGNQMTPRYMLTGVLGGAIGFGFLLRGVAVPGRWFVLIAALATYAFPLPGLVRDWVAGTLTERRTAHTASLETALLSRDDRSIPIVISHGFQYLPLTRYLTAQLQRRLYAVVDPAAAVDYTGTDSIDRNLLSLRPYVDLRIVDYADFVESHRRFLLVSDGGVYEWLPARLLDSGYRLMLIKESDGVRIFDVDLNAPELSVASDESARNRSRSYLTSQKGKKDLRVF